MLDHSSLWQVRPTTQLRWREWDGEFVVYNSESGQTHYLNGLAAKVLQYFEAQPASFASLMGDIELDDKAAGHAQPLLKQLSDLVNELDELGLIAPVAP